MAFNREKYNLLFPRDKKPAFDPISPSPVETQADSIQANAPSASPAPRRALPIQPLGERKPDEDSGFMENMARQFGAGVVQTGEMLMGAAEYGARQFDITDGIVADTIYSGRSGLAGVREDILSGINEADLQKASSELLTLDPDRTIWQGNPLDVAEAILYKTANALPATLVTLIPAARWARAASPGNAVAYMGASEGVMSLGGIQNGIADEIIAIPTEQLLQESPRFAQLLEANGGNADEARKELIAEAQGFAPLVGGASVAAISSVAGRFFTPIFEKGGGAALGSRVARGFAAEAPQEGAQGGAEQLVQNYAAKIYDLDRQLSEGVAEAVAQEGLLGGIMGGGFAGAFGERQAPPPAPPPDLDARPEFTEQPDLPGFEPGGKLPDELDQPMPEPEMDLQAQIDDLINEKSPRQGVYIAPGTDERLVASIAETLPEQLVFTRNIDGQGGHLISKSAKLALEAQKAIANGTSRQAVIGRIVGAGVGKPTNPNSRVVQLIDATGAVARESMVANQQEAEALGVEWSKEKGNKDLKVIVLSPQEALERRDVLNAGGGEFGIQGDLFEQQRDELPVPYVPEGGEQLDLPLTNERQRGVGRVPLAKPDVQGPQANTLVDDEGRAFTGPKGTEPPSPPQNQIGVDLTDDQEEVSRHQYGMDFEDSGIDTVTRRSRSTKKTGRYLVRMYDDEGQVVEEAVRNSPIGAETTADDWANQYPEWNVQIVPETEAETQVRTRAEKRQAKPIEPVYEQPIDEEIQDEIRTNVPFEERDEPLSKVKGSRSYGEASDRLIDEAAAAYDEEQKAMIGGFHHPDRLTFEPKKAPPKKNGKPNTQLQSKLDQEAAEYEKAYRDAWSQLVDEELRFEMTGTKTKKRTELLQELGKLRQVAKPKVGKGRSEKLFAAARAVNPAAVREYEKSVAPDKGDDGSPKQYGTATAQRKVEEDYLGEFEGGTREEIDNLAAYVVRHKTRKSTEWTEEEFDDARAAYARRDEIRKRYPRRTVKVDVLNTRALDEEFERAVAYREGREAESRVELTKDEKKALKKETKKRLAKQAKAEEKAEKTGEAPADVAALDLNKDYVEEKIEDDTYLGQDAEGNVRIDRSKFLKPGDKLKFIRREAESKRRVDTGQKSVTASTVRKNASELKQKPGESEQEFNKRKKKARGGRKLDTGPLTTEHYPLDESVSARVKREARAKKAHEDVGAAATRARATLRKLSTKKVTNSVSYKLRGDFLYARQYLKGLIEFARSLQKSKSKSNESAALAEAVTKMLDAAVNMTPEKFAKDWGAIAKKNEFDQLEGLKFTNLAPMRTASKRAKATGDTNDRIIREKVWREFRQGTVDVYLKGDPLYQHFIRPVIRKMLDYIYDNATGKTTVPYIPTKEEVAEIHYAMNSLRRGGEPFNATRRKSIEGMQGEMDLLGTDTEANVYEPLVEELMYFGFQFNEEGDVESFEPGDHYLSFRYRERFKGQSEVSEATIRRSIKSWRENADVRQEGIDQGKVAPPKVTPATDDQIKPRVKRTERQAKDDEVAVADAIAALDKRKQQIAKNERAVAEGRPRKRLYDPHTREVTPGLMTVDAVNGLIERFQKAVRSSKTTISGIRRAEARFIRALKKAGVWRQTGPETGVIGIPGGTSKNYRLVSKRLGKTLQKGAAREVVAKLKPFPVPKSMLAAVRAARQDQETVAGVAKFLDDAAIDLFNDATGPVTYDAEYTGVAERVGDLLMAGKVAATDVVNTILEIAPQNSFYRNLAVRLSEHNLSDVTVAYGTDEDFPEGQFGKFSRSKNAILLNREAINMHRLNNDETKGARAVHTMLHESVHAVTHMNVDNNASLRRYLEGLQQHARNMWRTRIGKEMPYGLKTLVKSENEVHEFIAEAFSNHEFQNFLKETPSERSVIKNMWRDFVAAVREILGLPPKTRSSLFDAIMLTEDVLFDDAGFGGSVSQGDLYLTGEGVIDNISTHVQGLTEKSFGWFDKLREAGRNLMTFEQLRDTYSKYFTDGSFARYFDAWSRRNSAISKHMKLPEKLSTRWTELEASDPASAVEISRIGTEATIDKLTPSVELTAQQRADTSATRLKKYDALRSRFNKLPPKAQQLYRDLRQYYKDAQAEETNLLLDAALRGVMTKGKGARMTIEQYRDKFPREVIAELTKKEDITAALKEIVPEEELGDLVKQLQRMASLRTISHGDYFPLMRYGDYTVYAETVHPDQYFNDTREANAKRAELLEEDPTLDVGVFEKDGRVVLRVTEKEYWMFESKTEAARKRTELQAVYRKVSPVQAKMRAGKSSIAIDSNAALTTILDTLAGNPAAQAAIKNHYLRSLSDQSFRKHELRRTNRRGVDYDSQHRNLANYLKQSAYYRAQLQHGWRMAEALVDMRKFVKARTTDEGITTEQLGRVVDNVYDRDAMTNEPNELNRMVRKGVNLTQFMMLTSPSYWMINATQPWLVTAPIMGGKYGMGNSYAALKHALSLVKTPLTKEAFASKFGFSALTDPVATEKAFNVVDQLFEHLKNSGDPRAQEYIELIDELRDINIIDINVLTELRNIAEGVEGKLSTKVLDASRILAHITEVNNRVITAIAAYNLAMNDGATRQEARDYAADMVSQTQFNYSSENKPPLFQAGGPLKWAAPLMFQFMQWPQHMYALLIRNVHAAVKGESKKVRRAALKSLVGLLGTHAAVGGMVGMTLQPIKWAFGMLMFAFGDDDEPYTFANAINGRTFDEMIASTMSELFGNEIGRALAQGLPTLVGADLSARMSMGTLYFVDLRGDTAESVLGSMVASFGGATLNQAMNWGNALNKVASGDVYRGIEQASPKILRDVLRAGRYYNEGLVNNAGDTVIPAADMSFGEVFLQGMGFQPDEVSRYYQGQAAIKGAQGYARDRRESLIKRFVKDGISAEVMREVMEFNRAYPSMKITRSSLVQSARAQVEREGRYGQFGANIDEKEAADFADKANPYR